MGNTLLILELDSKEKMAQVTDACDRFCRWAYRIMGAVVTAGIGTVCDSLRDISISYEGAKRYARFLIVCCMVQSAPSTSERLSQKSRSRQRSRKRSACRSFFARSVSVIRKRLRRWHTRKLRKFIKNTETISQHNLATLEIVSRFVRFCTNNSLDFNEISGYSQNIYEKVSQMDESLLTNWTVNMSMAISDCLMNARNNTSKRLIVDAQNIVKDRYMEADISLDEVCAQLGVSNSYFSSIFKKEVGKSFISYLTDYRMDIAEDLVLNTDEKSYTIAEKVGYLDANYFRLRV